MAHFDRALYLSILQMLIGWINEGEDERMDPRAENVECCRETCRSVLTVCGVHRLTACFGEAWQVFTALKAYGPSTWATLAPTPSLHSAAPALQPGDLHLLGSVGHASILEEEMSAALDWLDELNGLR